MWMMPEKTQYMMHQNKHEPTRSYGEQLHKVAENFAKNKFKVDALEIGCAWGVSALAFLTVDNITLTSVDKNTKTRAMEEVPINGYKDRWTFIGYPSDKFWESEHCKSYDLIYIDGSHKYGECRNDFYKAWEHLKEYGILIVDDYCHPKNQEVEEDGTVEYGVSLALCEFMRDHKFQRINAYKNIFVIHRGQNA